MPGPLPNPNSRRSRTRANFTTLPADGPDGPTPKLPATTADGADWHPQVRDAWATWWASPMATQWADADRTGVLLAAEQLQRALGGSQRAGVEVRQWLDRLGLTPVGRLRNRWQLPDEAAAATGVADDVAVGADVVLLRPAGD